MKKNLFLIGLFYGLLALQTTLAWPKNVTDILGNQVTLPSPPKRIVLASGYSFLSVAFIDPNPVTKLVAWGSELKRFDTQTYSLFAKQFPELTQLPTIGSGSGDELSAELMISLNPDLVILDAWQEKGSAELTERLKKANIPFIYIDFYQSPLKHTVPSIQLLGQVWDREDAAHQLIDYYQSHMAQLTSRLSAQPLDNPTVLLHAYPGLWECCWSSGSQGVGEYISLFNGRNIGASRFPNANGGSLSLEQIIIDDPAIYIATGHSDVDPNIGLPIGTNIEASLAQRQLQKIIGAPGLSTIHAVENQRVYGFWNYFTISPFNLVGAQVMAKWLLPELYQDIDPQKTMDEMNQRFLPVPLKGTYWIALE